MQKIFSFGELLLRFSPVLNRIWIDQASIPVYIGGAELNVATALANWQVPVRYFSAVPDHYMSREILEVLQSKNIDVSTVHFSGKRIGTYYLPQGVELKNAGVIYDRTGSSFGSLEIGMIDWDRALANCSWLHFSAISPALNENIAAVCEEALEVASAKGLTISVDLNFRSKLWQYGKKPTEVMPALVSKCHVIMGNIWSAEELLGVKSPIISSEGRSKDELAEAAGKSMLELHQKFPLAQTFGYTFRLEDTYWGLIQHGSEMKISRDFPVGGVVDKAGSGDCFMAGIIYGLINKHSLQEIIDFSAAAASGKLYEKGDATNQTIEHVKSRLI